MKIENLSKIADLCIKAAIAIAAAIAAIRAEVKVENINVPAEVRDADLHSSFFFPTHGCLPEVGSKRGSTQYKN